MLVSPWDVVTVRVSQAWFWHSVLKQSHPRHSLCSVSKCSGLRAMSGFLPTVHGETGLWGLFAKACEKRSAHSMQTRQARPAGQFPCPVTHGCSARQGSSTEWENWALAAGLAALQPPDTVRQENANEALEMTTKQGVHVQLIHGLASELDVLAKKATNLTGGDPPQCRCVWDDSGASQRAAPRVLSESGVDRTNRSTAPTPFLSEHKQL